MLCLLTVLLVNGTTIVYLGVELGNSEAFAEIQRLNLNSTLNYGYSRREWLFYSKAYFQKAVD